MAQPVVYNVPYTKYEYEPVTEPCDPCCCGDKKGITKITNHTSVNWLTGGKKVKTVEEHDFDEDEEKMKDPNRPKNWSDVVNKFNVMNGENILGGNQIMPNLEARKNLKRLSDFAPEEE